MPVSSSRPFESITTEGGLLPPDLLARIADLDPDLDGLTPGSYHLAEGERIHEAIARAWSVTCSAWSRFQEATSGLAEGDAKTGVTRERWLLPLFKELGFGQLASQRAIEVEGKTYAVSHGWHHSPIHLVGCGLELDKKTPGERGAARMSPHGLVQEFLNRSEEHLWGFVSNGYALRMLRDNAALTRQSYVEFDLQAIWDEERYADFALLWLLCHPSRVEAPKPADCWLEKWSRTAHDEGAPALNKLRDGVQRAIEALGSGFLAHPGNGVLHEKLRTGTLAKEDYYRQLLRLAYRLIFLLVAEARGLLLSPQADERASERFRQYYSTERLRRLAERRRGTAHGDLWYGLRLVMRALGSESGCPSLALPALGGFLWSEKGLADLEPCELTNRALLEAMRALLFREEDRMLRPVDWKHLGAEELGGIYESLLELHPELNREAGTLVLEVAAGNERKTTGSYYTPASLVACLLESALDPVLDDAAKSADPVNALLALKVCDPACGSGHFLIAAANKIAKRLAAARTPGEEPAPPAVRSALRDVIGHCLYGVDVNPMAVELCKVNLWLEALEPGRPLSFLDHRIVCGNALIGTTPRLIAEGIPDDAFDPIEGDDPKTAQAYKRQNKNERTQQATTLFAEVETGIAVSDGELEEGFAALDAIDDSSIEGVRRKEEAFRKALSSDAYLRSRFIADTWCSAFVWPKSPGAPEPVTEGFFVRLREEGHSPNSATRSEVQRLASEYAFLHWHVAFPEVFRLPRPSEKPTDTFNGWSGGFDVLLGNPPWERVELQEEEFFALRAPDIANAKNAAARRKLILALPASDPALAAEYARAVRAAEAGSRFLRVSGRFPLGGVGKINTYAVFADLSRQLIGPSGMAGLILPNGLVAGFTYREFLRHLLRTQTLASFFGFENEDRIFPAVHNETKFGILTMTGGKRTTEQPWLTAHVRQPSEVHDPARRYSLTASEIEAINPNTLNLPTFRWAADAQVTATIHAAAPVLIRRREDGRVENPWGVRFKQLFNMATDSGLFIDHDEIATRITARSGSAAILDDGSILYPLYEGKMLWHFDHRYGTYDGQTEKQANKGVLPHVTDATHDHPAYRVQPRYWVAADKTREALGEAADQEWFFAWRDTGISERTMIGAIIPHTAAGDKAPLLTITGDAREMAALCAILSSLVVDFDARQRATLMKLFVVEQLAVLTPHQLATPVMWLGASARDWLAERVHELSYTSDDLAPFARALGNEGRPFRWLPDRRALMQAEVDAAVLHLYGLSREQAEWLIDSFTVLRKYEEREFKEFRTKRMTLERFDAMDTARVSGTVYSSPLDPPAASPEVSHPPYD